MKARCPRCKAILLIPAVTAGDSGPSDTVDGTTVSTDAGSHRSSEFLPTALPVSTARRPDVQGNQQPPLSTVNTPTVAIGPDGQPIPIARAVQPPVAIATGGSDPLRRVHNQRGWRGIRRTAVGWLTTTACLALLAALLLKMAKSPNGVVSFDIPVAIRPFCEIIIDGKRLPHDELAPFDFTLPAGTHHFTLRRQGFRDVDLVVDLLAGETVTKPPAWRPLVVDAEGEAELEPVEN